MVTNEISEQTDRTSSSNNENLNESASANHRDRTMFKMQKLFMLVVVILILYKFLGVRLNCIGGLPRDPIDYFCNEKFLEQSNALGHYVRILIKACQNDLALSYGLIDASQIHFQSLCKLLHKVYVTMYLPCIVDIPNLERCNLEKVRSGSRYSRLTTITTTMSRK